MIRGLATGIAGRKVSKAIGGGTLGTAAAAALPFIARKGLGPLGLALTGVWAFKKFKEYRARQKARTYPQTAAPAAPPVA